MEENAKNNADSLPQYCVFNIAKTGPHAFPIPKPHRGSFCGVPVLNSYVDYGVPPANMERESQDRQWQLGDMPGWHE